MSCFPLTRSWLPLTLCIGCIDQALTDGREALVRADSGGEDSDSGLDSGIEPACSVGQLGEDDGLPLRRAAEVTEGDKEGAIISFGYGLVPAATPDGAALWVSGAYSWWADAARDPDGAYLLRRPAWDRETLGMDASPMLYTDEPVGMQLVASLLTGSVDSPETAFWMATPGTEADKWDGSRMWLFTEAPSRSVDVVAASTAELTVASSDGYRSIFGDYDGDGLDDLIVPGSPSRLFLLPLMGDVDDSGADVVFPDVLLDGVARLQLTDAATVDLDGDGHGDLVWKQAAGEREDHTRFDLYFKLGPLSTFWDAADGFLVDDFTRLPASGAGSSYTQYSSVRAVGDVTGDGQPDATAEFADDAGGLEGASSLFVVDRLPLGSGSLADLGTRLVGVPGQDPTNTSSSGLGSGGGGDANGDGVGDLVVFQSDTRLYDGSDHRAYVVTGPLDGVVQLAESSAEIRLPVADSAVSETNAAALVPDMDADGMDDVVVNFVDGANPGVVWLFPGCPEW